MTDKGIVVHKNLMWFDQAQRKFDLPNLPPDIDREWAVYNLDNKTIFGSTMTDPSVVKEFSVVGDKLVLERTVK